MTRYVRSLLTRPHGGSAAQRELAEKTAPSVKIGLRSLQLAYRSTVTRGEPPPSIWDTGFRVFSEYDEDGVIHFLLSVVGTGSRRFVDIGAGDGVHASNCANLAFNLGFHGVFVEADEQSVANGKAMYGAHRDTRRYPPVFVGAFVTAENVDDLLLAAGFDGDVDVLSIDVDGNDYWLWRALECVRPRIVVIETHDEYGLEDVVAPYDPDYVWHEAPPGSLIGASPSAMTKLATDLGYRLVGGNRLGFNAVYLRQDLASGVVPTIDVRQLLWHDRNRHISRSAPSA